MRVVFFVLFIFSFLHSQIQVQKIATKKLDEASGLLVSKKYPNILWSHNDSGDKARLYALDKKTLKLLKKIKVKKATNRDWEDISYFGDKIVIGDFGNNSNRRKDLSIYTINEPNPYTDKKVKVVKKTDFIFSDQKSSKFRRRNFDCEAMFSFNNELYLLTKHRADTDTTLYILKDNIAKKIATHKLDDKVTAADSDGKRIVILTYSSVYLLTPKANKKNLFKGKWKQMKFPDEAQYEGIALDGEYIHVISEEGNLYTLHVSDIK